jgi:phage gp45-like
VTADLVGDLRTLALRATVQGIDDSGALQLADVQPFDGGALTQIEVATPWGFVSVPPAGAIAIVLAIGADPADRMVLTLVHPGARMGNLAAGEVAIHDAAGNRVHIRQGGTIDVQAATAVHVTAPTVVVTAGSGVEIAGNVSITGTLSVTGAIHGTADVAHSLG